MGFGLPSTISRPSTGYTSGRRTRLNRPLPRFVTGPTGDWAKGYVLAFLLTILVLSLYGMPSSNAMAATNGIDVYVVDPVGKQPVLTTTLPKLAIKKTQIDVRAAKGEIEPLSFVLKSVFKDIEDVELVKRELAGNTHTLDVSNIDIRIVKRWYQNPGEASSLGATYKAGGRRLVPELLLKDEGLIRVDHENKRNYLRLDFPSGSRFVSISEELPESRSRIIARLEDFPVRDSKKIQPITLTKGEYKQIWITLKVPDEIKEGVYQGGIDVIRKGRVLATIILNLEVLPFKLLKSNKVYSIYYRGRLAKKGSISSELKNMMQYHAEQKNMAEHGIDIPTLYQGRGERELSTALQIRDKYWPDSKPLYYLGLGTGNGRSKSALKSLEREVQHLLAITRRFNISDVYIYGIDEARGDMLISQIQAWDTARRNGVKVFTAGYRGTYDKVGEYLDLLNLGGYPQKDEIEKFRINGKKIFIYGYPQTANENPYIFRKNYGLELWRNGYDGAMPYAYQDSMGFIWNDFDNRSYRDHAFTYPTVDGVIDTIAWEGFREAIDDVRYIATLENYIVSSMVPAEEQIPESLQRAKKLLERLKYHGAKDLNKMRGEIINSILEIMDSKQKTHEVIRKIN